MNERMYGVVKGGFVFLAGLMVGAGTGFVLAPESGARTRRRLRTMVEDLGERAGDIAADARWEVDRMIERGKRLVG
jgi:gas vesicle protein